LQNTEVSENDWEKDKSMGDSKKRHHKIHPEEENLDQLSIRPIQADDSRQICKRYSLKK